MSSWLHVHYNNPITDDALEQIKTKVKKVKTVNLVNGLAHGLLRTATVLIPNNTELLLDSRGQLLDLLF
ncbi:hypothetical protein YC2023_009821 [Brassica napus]